MKTFILFYSIMDFYLESISSSGGGESVEHNMRILSSSPTTLLIRSR